MIKVVVIGASGYSGAQLAALLSEHPGFELSGLYVSETSVDAHKPLSALYPQWLGKVDLPLQPLTSSALAELPGKARVACLATDHGVSATLAPQLLSAGMTVADLSGAYRLADPELYPRHYGFTHPQADLLSQAQYGLVEWVETLDADLIAVPGCYPTASLLALKPLKTAGLIAPDSVPVINAVSGVSGAGRKASLNSSFCQVSLAPYGVLGHRHQPEIEMALDHPVVFTPHLGAFKRGILATITVTVPEGTSDEQVLAAFAHYQASEVVKVLPQGQWPNLDAVVHTPCCLLGWRLDPQRRVLVIASAIDNLMKGAASQALQCLESRFGVGGAQ